VNFCATSIAFTVAADRHIRLVLVRDLQR